MANQWLTGSGEPTLGTGVVTDYYRDTVTNLVYYRENLTTWVTVSAFTPNPDGVGTTWLHGTVPPLASQGEDGDYFYEETDKIVYRKVGSIWVAKGSLDFIGIYGVQWGNGLGAPANTPPLNALPAGSFYFDVTTSDFYFKPPSMVWELKGQLGGGGGSGSAVTVEDVLTSTSSVNALSANQGRLLKNLADSKLDATAYNDRYQGVYASLSALQTAKPTGAAGDYATVDTGSGNNAQLALWDANDGDWVLAGSVSLSTTDALPEGSSNRYFTNARAQAATLQPTINTQTSNYTLQPVDNDGKTYLRMTSSSANTVTIPSNQTLPISITQRGTGTTTLVADSGVTLNGTLAFSAQHQTKSVIPVGSNAFDVVG